MARAPCLGKAEHMQRHADPIANIGERPALSKCAPTFVLKWLARDTVIQVEHWVMSLRATHRGSYRPSPYATACRSNLHASDQDATECC